MPMVMPMCMMKVNLNKAFPRVDPDFRQAFENSRPEPSASLKVGKSTLL